MNLKIQLSGFFEIFGHPCPDIQGLAVHHQSASPLKKIWEDNNRSDNGKILIILLTTTAVHMIIKIFLSLL